MRRPTSLPTSCCTHFSHLSGSTKAAATGYTSACRGSRRRSASGDVGVLSSWAEGSSDPAAGMSREALAVRS